MSRKKSDIVAYASPHTPRQPRGPWWAAFISNAPLPLLLLLLIPIGLFIEGRTFGAYNQRIVMLVGFNVLLAVSLQLINGFSGQFSLGHAGFMAVGAYLAAYPALNHSQRLSNPAESLLFFLALLFTCAIASAGLYGLFLLMRLTRKVHPTLPAVLLVAVLAWIVADVANASKHDVPPAYFVWSKAIAELQDSFTWIIERGTPLAVRISAALPGVTQQPLCYLVLLIGGGLGAAATGFIVGLPTLRLRGDYLAIATLGLAEIIRILIQNARPLGGALGLTGIPKYTNFAWLYGAAIVTIAVIWRLAYSAKGRAIMAVREDEIAAAAAGIDPTHHKVTAFVIGAFFAGICGAMFALHERSITPSYFGFQKSIEIVVMVTLGGLGSISGAVLAAAVLTLMPEVLRDPPSLWPWGYVVVVALAMVLIRVRRGTAMRDVIILFGVCLAWEILRWIAKRFDVDLSQFRMIIYSLLLITMMLLRPQGLLGGRELWPRRWRRDPVPTEDRDDRGDAAPGVATA